MNKGEKKKIRKELREFSIKIGKSQSTPEMKSKIEAKIAEEEEIFKDSAAS